MKRFFLLMGIFLLILNVKMKKDIVYAAELPETERKMGTEQIDELLEAYMRELKLDEVQEYLDQILPVEGISLKEEVYRLCKGELPRNKETIKKIAEQALLKELSAQKQMVIQLFLLSVGAAVFSAMIRIFENSQISEISFYILYLLLFMMLMKLFSHMSKQTEETLCQVLQFMHLLIPIYLAAVSLAAGTVTAIGFYETTLLFLTAAQTLLNEIVIPGIRIYVLVLLLNQISKEAYLQKGSRLIRTGISWILKTLLFFSIGMQTVQSLLFPAIDRIKNSLWIRALQSVPVVGNTWNTVTETIVGASLLLKNALGVTGMLALLFVCLNPVVRLMTAFFLYKALSAAVQPISDRRISDCIDAVSEGAFLLLKTVTVTAIVLLLTIVLITSSVKGG